MRKCAYCENYYTESTCGYTSSNCRIYGSLDCDQTERHPDTAAAACPDFKEYVPFEFIKRKHNPDTLEWGDLVYAASKYNIPPTAKIQLATGWECSTTEADKIYYNIQENIFAISHSCDHWFDSADWILIGKLNSPT